MALLRRLSPVSLPLAQDRGTRVGELVDSTFGLSLRDLRSFLDRECAHDPQLRAEVERRIVERETVASPHRPAAAALSSLATGDVVGGRYLITRLIGRGGMGEVYEAHDLCTSGRPHEDAEVVGPLE